MIILNQTEHAFVVNFAFSLIALVFYFIALWAYQFFLIRSGKSNAKVKRKTLRMRYILGVILFIIVLKIWVKDFGHLFTALGLVSAALLMINKESLMNIMGCLIIMWRDLFSEGDYIELNGKSGYVLSMGIFYITLTDCDGTSTSIKTSKIQKIPNSQIITNSITNYIQPYVLFDVKVLVRFVPKPGYKDLIASIEALLKTLIQNYTKELDVRDSMKQIILDSTHLSYKPDFDKTDHVLLNLNTKCLFSDRDKINDQINAEIAQLLFQNDPTPIEENLESQSV